MNLHEIHILWIILYFIAGTAVNLLIVYANYKEITVGSLVLSTLLSFLLPLSLILLFIDIFEYVRKKHFWNYKIIDRK